MNFLEKSSQKRVDVLVIFKTLKEIVSKKFSRNNSGFIPTELKTRV
jgi:hypothetical protein